MSASCLRKGYEYLTRNNIKSMFSNYINVLSFILCTICMKPKRPKKGYSYTMYKFIYGRMCYCGSTMTITKKVLRNMFEDHCASIHEKRIELSTEIENNC